jgi:hypothetical protein
MSYNMAICNCGNPIILNRVNVILPEAPWVQVGEVTWCRICRKRYSIKAIENKYNITTGQIERAIVKNPLGRDFYLNELDGTIGKAKEYDPNEYLGERD